MRATAIRPAFLLAAGTCVALPPRPSPSRRSRLRPRRDTAVPDGFVIEQVAGEPDTVFPMFACFDDRGRLFVAESSGLDLYAEISAGTRKCRIRMLEDRDGDGRFETSSVFADKLVFPMGLVWRDGKLYVADPPDLVTYEDTDGDGRADQRTVILTGFGHKDNGSLHGLTFGPDGLLYMTMGSPDGYKLKRKDGSVLEGESGALIRCRPDGSDPEVLCRGFENLVEVVWTPRGEAIGTDNWFRDANSQGQRRAARRPRPPHRRRAVPVPPRSRHAAAGHRRPARAGVAVPGVRPERAGPLRGHAVPGRVSRQPVHRAAQQPGGRPARPRSPTAPRSGPRTFRSSPATTRTSTRRTCSRTPTAACWWSIPAAGTSTTARPGSIRKTRAAGGIWRVRRVGADRPKPTRGG